MSMEDRDGKIWMDGQLVDWRDAKIHVLTYTLHYGCGAFEGVRAYKTDKGTAIFRLKEHTERLFNSGKILRMKIPFTPQEVEEAQKAVVRENQLESLLPAPLDLDWLREAGRQPQGQQGSMRWWRPGAGAPTSARKVSSAASASRPVPTRATTSTSR